MRRWIIVMEGALQRLRFVLQMIEAGTGREMSVLHYNLLSVCARCPRARAERRSIICLYSRGGLSPFRGPDAPCCAQNMLTIRGHELKSDHCAFSRKAVSLSGQRRLDFCARPKKACTTRDTPLGTHTCSGDRGRIHMGNERVAYKGGKNSPRGARGCARQQIS
jgi:hypothetical protein